jgi:hypothetical protein
MKRLEIVGSGYDIGNLSTQSDIEKFYRGNEIQSDEVFGKNQELEFIVRDVKLEYQHQPVKIYKATFINSYPERYYEFEITKCIIKSVDSRKTVLSINHNFIADHCLIYKCDISRRGRKQFDVPMCKFLYLDKCRVMKEGELLVYSTPEFPVKCIYFNNCYLEEFNQDYTISHLQFVSFDTSAEQYEYSRAIQYFKSKKVEVRYHTEEEFKSLIEKEFIYELGPIV